MDHSPSEQSLSDRTPDVKCSQPQIFHPTNKIQTSFEELCDPQPDHTRKSNRKILMLRYEEETYLSVLFILATETRVVKPLTSNSEADKTPELSRKAVPVPALVITSVKNYDIQPLPGSSKFKIKFLT
jgi:hypothetical protein